MVTIQTPMCMICGIASEVEVTEEEYVHLGSSTHRHIQDALPNRDADFRELLISGTHPACWDTMADSVEEL